MSVVLIKGFFNSSRTDLAASVPQRNWVIVGGVGPGARWVDTAQLLHVVADEGVRCREMEWISWLPIAHTLSNTRRDSRNLGLIKTFVLILLK